MKNQVGDNVPAQAVIDQLLAKLIGVATDLAKFCIVLEVDARKNMNHPRVGADAHVERAHQLCATYGVSVAGVSADGMMNDLRLAQQLRAFVPVVESLTRLVTDTQLEAGVEYWQAFLALYDALTTAAAHNPALADELGPLKEFMKAGVRTRRENAARAAKAVEEAAAQAKAAAEATKKPGP